MITTEYQIPHTQEQAKDTSRAYIFKQTIENIDTTLKMQEEQEKREIRGLILSINNKTKGKYEIYGKNLQPLYDILTENTFEKNYLEIYAKRYPPQFFFSFRLSHDEYIFLLMRKILQDLNMSINTDSPYANNEERTLFSQGTKTSIDPTQREILKTFSTPEKLEKIGEISCIMLSTKTEPDASGRVVVPNTNTFYKILPEGKILSEQETESIENEEIMHILNHEAFGKNISPSTKIPLVSPRLKKIQPLGYTSCNEIDEFLGGMIALYTNPDAMEILFADALKEEVNKTINQTEYPQYEFKRQRALHILRTMILNDEGIDQLLSTYKQVGRTKETRTSIHKIAKALRQSASPEKKEQVLQNMKEVATELIKALPKTK